MNDNHFLESFDFLVVDSIEYFKFEKEFIDGGFRCIPMVVRLKMDKAGIKLKLAEWSIFTEKERLELAKKQCRNKMETKKFKSYLKGLVRKHTGSAATIFAVDENPAWANTSEVPEMFLSKIKSYGWSIAVDQWKKLSCLQRFALLKLSNDGHEHKNLPKAMKEFGLI
jgi:hypothetical protein